MRNSNKMEEVLKLLKNIQERQISMEHKFRGLERKVADITIMQRRNAAKLLEGLKACQKAFLMGCEQQYELREELSEFAGDCVDNESRMRFV